MYGGGGVPEIHFSFSDSTPRFLGRLRAFGGAVSSILSARVATGRWNPPTLGLEGEIPILKCRPPIGICDRAGADAYGFYRGSDPTYEAARTK
jgi:hypothetical protein